MDNKKLGNGLVPRQITDRNGKLTTVYVRSSSAPEEDTSAVMNASSRPRKKTGLTELRMARSLGLGDSIEEIDRRSTVLMDELVRRPILLDNSENRSKFVAAAAYLRARHEALVNQRAFLDSESDNQFTEPEKDENSIEEPTSAGKSDKQRASQFVDQNEAHTVVLEQIKDHFPDDYRRLPVSEDIELTTQIPVEVRDDIEHSTNRQLRAMPRSKRDARVERLQRRVEDSRNSARLATSKYLNKDGGQRPRTIGEAEDAQRGRPKRTTDELFRQGWGGRGGTRVKAQRKSEVPLMKLHAWLERKLGLEGQHNSPIIDYLKEQKENNSAARQQRRMNS